MKERTRPRRRSSSRGATERSQSQVRPDAIREYVAPRLEALGYELVDVRGGAAEGLSLVEILIDTPGGVGVEDCREVAEHVGVWLDLLDPSERRYMLQVSSPGFDRPLRTLEHFERFVGQRVRVALRAEAETVGGSRRLRGRLTGVVGQKIRLEGPEGEIEIDYQDIEQSRLDPEWDP